MKIFVTGLGTLHWGRLEYGNIGNYYIIAPLFRMLHKVFPQATITTTLQLTNEFAEKEKIIVLPMELYYGWRKDSIDTSEALAELAIAYVYRATGTYIAKTAYINEITNADLIVDFSGDMWGDNSDTMGENRFLVELLKIRVAQLLGKKTVLFASSPGPITNERTIEFAKIVYANYDAVINREAFSTEVMRKSGFDVSKTKDFACPAWLFNKDYYPAEVDSNAIRRNEHFSNERKNIGLILSTYSLPGGSFDSWERNDHDFDDFVMLVEHIVNVKHERVFLISHSNGFELPPNFKRIHWRDHKMISRLYELLLSRGKTDMENVKKIDTLYQPWEMHALIGNLDMLISGRVHGAVAGLEQAVPTIAFDYKNGPLAHKMSGFFDVIGMERYVIQRDDCNFIRYFDTAYQELNQIKDNLLVRCSIVRKLAEDSFVELQNVIKD